MGFPKGFQNWFLLLTEKAFLSNPRNQTESVIIYNIAPKKMLFDISYLISWWMVILWILPKISIVKNLGFSAVQVQGLFSLKVVVGIGFTLFYHYYYGSRTSTDAFRFYDDANLLFEVFKSDPITYTKIVFGIDMQSAPVIEATDQLNNWYKNHLHGVFNDNMTIIRFNALVRLFSFNVYHIHTLIINLLAFLGLAALVNATKSLVDNTKLSFLSILLFPGIIFWASAVLKESLLIFAMGFLTYYGLRAISSFSLKNISFFLLFLLFGMTIKSYVAIALSIGFGLLLASKITSIKTRLLAPLYLGLGAGSTVLLNALLNLNIPERFYQKQHDFLNEIAISKPGSAFDLFVLEPTWVSLFKTAPNAFSNALFRPFIWEAHSIISLVASFEILLLISLAIIALWFKQQLNQQQTQLIVAFSISAIVILLIAGWVTPVFGALVRYKIPALILILIILNILVDTKKIPFIQKWLN